MGNYPIPLSTWPIPRPQARGRDVHLPELARHSRRNRVSGCLGACPLRRPDTFQEHGFLPDRGFLVFSFACAKSSGDVARQPPLSSDVAEDGKWRSLSPPALYGLSSSLPVRLAPPLICPFLVLALPGGLLFCCPAPGALLWFASAPRVVVGRLATPLVLASSAVASTPALKSPFRWAMERGKPYWKQAEVKWSLCGWRNLAGLLSGSVDDFGGFLNFDWEFYNGGRDYFVIVVLDFSGLEVFSIPEAGKHRIGL